MIDWQMNDMRDMGMELSLDTQESIENYLVLGWAPGGYLEAMFSHDYERAFACADTANRQSIWALWRWIRDYAPYASHGSYLAMTKWASDLDGCRSRWVVEQEKKAVWQKLSTVD